MIRKGSPNKPHQKKAANRSGRSARGGVRRTANLTKSHSAYLATRSFIQRVQQVVDQTANDYSREEKLFEHGVVKFIDTHAGADLQLIKESQRTKYIAEKGSVDSEFLENEPEVKSVSVIVPIKSHAEDVMEECLESIRQQTLIEHHPEKVEVIVVYDGPLSKRNKKKLRTQLRSFPHDTPCKLFQLAKMQGRAAARNLGIVHAKKTAEIVAFLDSSMILDKTCLAEQMLRHQRPSNVALLGFKENISKHNYEMRRKAPSGLPRPDYQKDWKWRHVLSQEEAPFDYKGTTYRPGDEIRYMDITNWLRRLRGSEQIGYRSLPKFFQTMFSPGFFGHWIECIHAAAPSARSCWRAWAGVR